MNLIFLEVTNAMKAMVRFPFYFTSIIGFLIIKLLNLHLNSLISILDSLKNKLINQTIYNIESFKTLEVAVKLKN
jgi:hypothetical protein